MIISLIALAVGTIAGVWIAIYFREFEPFIICFLAGVLVAILSFGICMTWNMFIPEEEKVFVLEDVEYPERIPGDGDGEFYLLADIDEGSVAYGYLVSPEYELKPRSISADIIHLHSDDSTPRIEYFRQAGYTRWHRYICAVPVSTVAHVYLPDAKESVIWGSAH